MEENDFLGDLCSFDSPEEAKPDTNGLSIYLQQLAALHADVEAKEKDLAQTKSVMNKLCEQVLQIFEVADLTSICAHGFSFSKKELESVKVPKTKEAKEQLFKFLLDKGIFYDVVSVHSQTLNALFRELSEQAAQSGNADFRLPGIEKPSSFTMLKIRRQNGR